MAYFVVLHYSLLCLYEMKEELTCLVSWTCCLDICWMLSWDSVSCYPKAEPSGSHVVETRRCLQFLKRSKFRNKLLSYLLFLWTVCFVTLSLPTVYSTELLCVLFKAQKSLKEINKIMKIYLQLHDSYMAASVTKIFGTIQFI